jgi:hypothetical protein
LRVPVRTVHLLTTMICTTEVVLNYSGEEDAIAAKFKEDPLYHTVLLANSFLLIISGLWLLYLERSEKVNLGATIYQHLSELKFVLGLLLTPLVYPCTAIFAEDEMSRQIAATTKVSLQMFVLSVVIILSLVSRYYREEISIQLVGDPVVEKVMELQKKFNIRKDEPEEPVEEKPRARPSKMAFLQKERSKHMMRDFEK